MVFGIAFNFVTIGGYVFREFSLGRSPRFVMCYLLIYFINLLSLTIITIWVSDKILAQAIVTIPSAFLSYYSLNRFVFSKILGTEGSE